MTQAESTPAQDQLYERILFTEAEVDARIDEMAGTIIKRYRDKDPLFVCLLRGGAPFSAKLMTSIARQDPHFHPELDYMTIRTYGNERTAKEPQVVMDLGPHTVLEGRPVVLLDDMLDSGVTVSFAAASLLERHASTVDTCVLVRKQREQTPFDGDVLYGFETPDMWQTGMGLNDSRMVRSGEANRWAGFVALANQ